MKSYDNSNVRRQERLLEEEAALELIRIGEFGILSLIENRDDKAAAYGIPLNYVWDGDRYIYFHCAPSGHKLTCIEQNPNASLCVVGHTKVISNEFSTAYESVILRGKIEKGLPADERMRALELILDKYSPEDKVVGMKYAEKSFPRTEILRLDIESISGKTKKIKP